MQRREYLCGVLYSLMAVLQRSDTTRQIAISTGPSLLVHLMLKKLCRIT
jgi:hypothetical protein